MPLTAFELALAIEGLLDLQGRHTRVIQRTPQLLGLRNVSVPQGSPRKGGRRDRLVNNHVGCCHQRGRTTHRERRELHRELWGHWHLSKLPRRTPVRRKVEFCQCRMASLMSATNKELSLEARQFRIDYNWLCSCGVALLQKVIFGERESLGQNQRHHKSDSDQTFEIGSACNDTWLVISDISTSTWSPIVNSEETQQVGFVPTRKDGELEVGTDRSKMNDKSGDHPKTWAKPKIRE